MQTKKEPTKAEQKEIDQTTKKVVDAMLNKINT